MTVPCLFHYVRVFVYDVNTLSEVSKKLNWYDLKLCSIILHDKPFISSLLRIQMDGWIGGVILIWRVVADTGIRISWRIASSHAASVEGAVLREYLEYGC